MPSPAVSRLRPKRSSEDPKRWPLSSSGSSGGVSVQQGFVASRVRALQEQQNRESESEPRPHAKPSLAYSHTSPEAGPFDAYLEDLPAGSCSNIAIPDIDERSNRLLERPDRNMKKACRVTAIPEQLTPWPRSSANIGTRSHHSNYEQRHTHIKTKTLSCVKESMCPRSIPPLDESPIEGKSLPTKPAQQQPQPGPKKELSTQLNPVANVKCNSKRSSSDLSLSSSKSETGALDRFSGDRAKSFEKLSSTGDAERYTSDTLSTRTGYSVNCSEPPVLNQLNPHPKEGLESEPGTANIGSTPSTPDASTGDPRRLVVDDQNRSSTDAETWTTKADDHLPKDGMAAESLSDLKTHSSAESLISNDPSILERSRSSLAFRQVSGPASTDVKEPNADKQAQKDPPRRNGSALGNLLTGKWLRTVGESKTPPVNQKASRKQDPASSTTYGTGNEIGGDEASDHGFDRIRKAKAGDAASTTSSSQTTINVNAVHDGSTVSRTATRPATPGLTAEQSEAVPEVASAKKAVKSATQEGKSPSHQSGSTPATSARGSPFEYSRYPVKSHAIDRARAGKPAAANLGDLRLTITFKDCITHGPAMRKAKVTVLLETEEDLMVETNVEKVEEESGRDDPSDQG